MLRRCGSETRVWTGLSTQFIREIDHRKENDGKADALSVSLSSDRINWHPRPFLATTSLRVVKLPHVATLAESLKRRKTSHDFGCFSNGQLKLSLETLFNKKNRLG